MKEHDLLWAMLPDGLSSFFDVENFEKTDLSFRITLTEKNTVPGDIPERYRGKKIVNNILKPVLVDFFPIKGRKTEIVVKRRYWQFEGSDEMFRREISLCAEGTKLEKEFADFLKEMDRV
jgi:hypothetical protein